MEIAVWILTAVLTLVGVAGVVLPILPGTTLILVAMIVHKLLLPAGWGWGAIGWITFVWAISIIVDFLGVLVGTRLFGGTKWGMAGASGGALIGMFFSLPALILGTIFGAMAAEKWVAKKTHRESLRAGFGAAFGFVLSTVGRLACALVMVALFLASAPWPRWTWW
ncbi:MAG TPA: DUF456 domain-containing protein [Candidatus Synoicihabitans sp.]|nr:DUF456 domain-containing protein [Candidatus Synoicihabitans sp.]